MSTYTVVDPKGDKLELTADGVEYQAGYFMFYLEPMNSSSHPDIGGRGKEYITFIHSEQVDKVMKEGEDVKARQVVGS